MATNGVILVICGAFVLTVVFRHTEAEGLFAMKSNSPSTPFVALSGSRAQRVRRQTSGSDLTEEERQIFLTSHNDYRKSVTPPAANMQKMVWHNELAAMAQEWADGCIWKHGNPDRNPKPFPYIGQNLYASTSSAADGSTATTAWYDEVADYTYDTNSCATGKVCGHYTQVVWAKSNYIGCAIAHCSDLLESTLGESQFIVCNYGPAGNFNHELPYERGLACTSCPEGTICEDGLCAHCDTLSCQNGGTFENCQCSCPNGFSGDVCDVDDNTDGGDNEGDNTDDGDNEGDNTDDGDNEGDNTDDGDNEGDNNTKDEGDTTTEGGDEEGDTTTEGGNEEGDTTTESDEGDGGDDDCFFFCARQAGYVATPVKWMYAVGCILALSTILQQY